MDLTWMAWTWPTAGFFVLIFLVLVGMSLWERIVPGGSPRHGVIGLDTTRGDRCFISLLSLSVRIREHDADTRTAPIWHGDCHGSRRPLRGETRHSHLDGPTQLPWSY